MSRIVFLALSVCSASVRLGGSAPERPGSVSDRFTIQFKDQLHISEDLRLRQSRDTASVKFKCESGCRPLPGSALHLFLQHSPELDESRSFVVISLNYGVLRSVRLDDRSEDLMELAIPLAAGQLKPENQLDIAVEQYPDTGRPNDAMWTLISDRSYISIQCESLPARLDLNHFPAPILDPYSYAPKRLAVLEPEHPSAATLEATALIVANLSARVAPDPVTIEILKSAKAVGSPLLVVGTPWEQSELDSMQPDAPFVLYQQKGEVRVGPVNGPRLADGEGLAGLFLDSRDQPQTVLFITGNSPGAVLRAARAVCSREASLGGRAMRISGDVSPPRPKLRVWRGFIPPANRFTLADLGFEEQPLDSQNNFSVQIPINAPPDASFLAYGHQMSLILKSQSPVQTQQGLLTVSLNDVSIGKLDLGKLAPGRATVKIPIAAGLLRNRNKLQILLKAPQSGGSFPSISIMPETSFFLPRDYSSRLPDLALLKDELYPFSLLSDLSDTVIVVPDDIDSTTFGILMDFCNYLGRAVPTNFLDFRVRQRSAVTEYEINSSNLIYFRIEPENPTGKNGEARTAPSGRPLGAPYVKESFSPGNSAKYVLTISAGSTRALARLSHALFSEGALNRLAGDTAYWTRHDIVCVSRIPRRDVRTIFYLTDFETWLRTNWIVLPLILTGASGILFVGMRLLLDRYVRGRRRTPKEPADVQA